MKGGTLWSADHTTAYTPSPPPSNLSPRTARTTIPTIPSIPPSPPPPLTIHLYTAPGQNKTNFPLLPSPNTFADSTHYSLQSAIPSAAEKEVSYCRLDMPSPRAPALPRRGNCCRPRRGRGRRCCGGRRRRGARACGRGGRGNVSCGGSDGLEDGLGREKWRGWRCRRGRGGRSIFRLRCWRGERRGGRGGRDGRYLWGRRWRGRFASRWRR